MSTYSNDLPGPKRLQTPLHTILGGGKVADILLWKDKRVTTSVLMALTTIWFLFEVVEYNLITFVCHISMATMLFVFIWASGAGFADWTSPELKTSTLSESTILWLFAKINWVFRSLYHISTGRDFQTFFLALAFLWILSTVASYFNTLNLLYIGFLLLATLPALYERYQKEMDHLASIAVGDAKRFYKKFDARILNKIPRGPVKENKRF